MSYKLSKYIVSTTYFDQKRDQYLQVVYSSRSGKVRLLDLGTWKAAEAGELSKIQPAIMADLLTDQMIVPEGENELSVVLKENRDHAQNDTDLYMAIQPTANCPFGCGYCGQEHSVKHLKDVDQDALFNRIQSKLELKDYKSLSISWFGAEPLSGFPVMEKLSPRIQKLAADRGLKYQAKIITNGLLMNEGVSKKLMYDYGVNFIEITLDGIAKYHDERRFLKTGGPSFDKIYKNLLAAVKIKPKDATISIRCNVDDRNREGISPLIQKLHEDGILSQVTIYFAQIHSWGNDAHKQAAEKKTFAQWEIDWMLELQELGHPVGFVPQRRKSLCMAVKPDAELIDPFGQVFNCTEVSLVPTYEKDGKNEYALGHVAEEKLANAQVRNKLGRFHEEEELKKVPCSSCPILPICGGMCPKLWAEGIDACPPAKFNIKERLLVQVANSALTEKRKDEAA